MLARLTLVFLCVMYLQYSSAKKYEEHGKDVIEQVKASNTTWKGGLSKFFKGKDVDDLKKSLGFKKPKKNAEDKEDHRAPTAKQLGRKDSAGRLVKRATTSLPTSFDWRDYTTCASVSDIRTQNCGDCWAVASAAAFSDRFCLYTKTDKYFAAKHISTCVDPTDPATGCEGGDPYLAAKFYNSTGVTTGGDPTISTEPAGCLKYPAVWTTPTKCPAKCDDGTSFAAVTKAAKVGQITNGSISSIQQQIYNYGPVVAAMDVFEDFYVYESGVYQYTYGKLEGGHAIRMIGWGVADDGTPYWLCLNQWGPDWGEAGAFRILRGKDHMGIEDYIIYAFPAESKLA